MSVVTANIMVLLFVQKKQSHGVAIYCLKRTIRTLIKIDQEARKLMGDKTKTCLGRVFIYKLGCYDDVHVLYYADAYPRL